MGPAAPPQPSPASLLRPQLQPPPASPAPAYGPGEVKGQMGAPRPWTEKETLTFLAVAEEIDLAGPVGAGGNKRDRWQTAMKAVNAVGEGGITERRVKIKWQNLRSSYLKARDKGKAGQESFQYY